MPVAQRPPSQIPASGIPAPGSSSQLALAYVTAEARIGRGNNSAGLAREREELFRKRVLDIENRV